MKIKVLLKSLIFLIVVAQNLLAQTTSDLLRQADDLFDQKNYTEAYEAYLRIFNERQQSSPEMLVKMAYISEGLGDYSLSLYYLNLYYRQTSEKIALRKMETLAKEHGLAGYEFNDFELFVNFYHKNYNQIVYSVLALSLLFFALIFRSVKRSQKPIGLLIGYMVVLGLLFYLINFGNLNNRGIITSEAFLMDAPSAASNLVELVKKGHKVKILKEEDVWLKIKWDNGNAFIRKNNIILLN